jgi:hypothetical protein
LETFLASQRRARATEFASPLLGGSGGTRNYNLDCGPSGVMIGVTYKSGSWLDALGLICQRVNRDGSLGDQYTRRAVGGSGGTSRIRRCVDGRVVGGIKVMSGSFVNRLTFYCVPWIASTKRPENFTLDDPNVQRGKECRRNSCFPIGVLGLPPFGSTRSGVFLCPGSKVGKALRGKYGTYIDSVSFVCDHWNK